jgi:two-component system response regulator FixJ
MGSDVAEDPTVFVVDDDTDLCEALRWLLESDGLKVETYTSARSFLNAYHPDRPGVLALDVRMPGMDGLELQDYLTTHGLTIPIIILTGHGTVPMAVRALKAGALEFLQKPVNDQALLDSIRRALRTDAENRRKRSSDEAMAARFNALTPREREVLSLVVAGYANKRMAALLGVSEKTIEVHRKHLMGKMQARSVVELVRMSLSLRAEDGPPVPTRDVRSRRAGARRGRQKTGTRQLRG